MNDIFYIEVFCDASDVGFGGYINTLSDTHFERIETFGNWTERKSDESSTWRELECVKCALNTFSQYIQKKRFKLHSDNKNAEHILKVGRK